MSIQRRNRWIFLLTIVLWFNHAILAGATILFDARIDYQVGSDPQSVAVGDFNSDGHDDLAVASSDPGAISILLARGDGTFAPATEFYVDDCTFIATEDFDGDGNLDLVTAKSDVGFARVRLGNGDGSFQGSTSYWCGWGGAPWFAIDDLNGDDHPDLVVASEGTTYDSGMVCVLLGIGDGTFQSAATCAYGTFLSVAAGDVDGDGYPDLVASHGYLDEVLVMLGNGDGTFQPGLSFSTGAEPRSVCIDDLNSDGYPDLVTANHAHDNLSILLGNGNGTFQTGQVHYLPTFDPLQVTTVDLDDDRDPDLIVTYKTYNAISVIFGDGDGTFQPAVDYGIGTYPRGHAVSDLEGDGSPDLIATNSGNGTVSVLLGSGGGEFSSALLMYQMIDPDFVDSIEIGDFNVDGAPDLAVAGSMMGQAAVLLGSGDGTFQLTEEFDAGMVIRDLVIGRINDDRYPDLAICGSYVNIFLGQGDGFFQDLIHIGDSGGTSMAAADFDRNGTLDLVTAYGDDDVSVLLGNGDGSFQPTAYVTVGPYPFAVAVDDVNGDGNQDVITANPNDASVCVLPGNGDGTFSAPAEYDCGNGSLSVAIHDLDGDGVKDLALSSLSGDILVMLGAGDGSFDEPVVYPAGDYTYAVIIDDLDGDGIADLAATNLESNNISVLLGNGDGTFQSAVHYGTGRDPMPIASGDLDGESGPELMTGGYGLFFLINATGPLPRVLAGPGPDRINPPLVGIFLPEQDAVAQFEFPAYGATGYGLNVACGKPDHGAADRILTGAGPGEIYGPHVRAFRANGAPLPGLNFLAYGTNKYGVNVAAGDIDADGFDEIITGAGPGAVFGPHVRGWDYDGSGTVTAISGVNYFAYGTPKWGVNVSAGDIDGDGFDEIVTGAGPGAVYGPHVRGWNVDGSEATAMPDCSFFAYGTLKYGVNVSCGDVDGDGIDEIVTGAGPGAVFGAHVRGWDYDGQALAELPGLNFFAWEYPLVSYGGKVSAGADLDGDGRTELVVGCGPDPDVDTEVKVFTYNGATVNQWISFEAFPGMSHGTNVAAGRF